VSEPSAEWTILAGRRAAIGEQSCSACGCTVTDLRRYGWSDETQPPVFCAVCGCLSILRNRCVAVWRDPRLYATAARLGLWEDVETVDLGGVHIDPYRPGHYDFN
jgi:hypothetical protein